jgi:predicted glycogen debranching enzyme
MRADSYVDGNRCRNFEQSSSLEWLDTNGTGAYAMGTVAGIRTRRYHSLLNAPLTAGEPTQVWLSALEDILYLDGVSYELAAHRYPSAVSPRGFEMLGEFRMAPYPSWLYRIGEATLAREVMLIDGQAAVMVRYCCSEDATLTLRPFLAGRGQHSLVRAERGLEWVAEAGEGHLALRRDGAALHIRSDAKAFEAEPDWYYRFQYAVDRGRGLDFEEDLFTPGLLRFALRADTWVYLVCSLNEDSGPLDPLALLGAIEAKEKRFPVPRNLVGRLANAAEHFVFEQKGRKSVIAGYPWFTDWGRDTFISLPGLMLARNRLDEAARTIDNFLSLRQDGLIPNRITDDGSTPEYNSIDATLWLYIAVWQWLECGGSRELFQDRFFAPMRDMLQRVGRGTLYGIHCDVQDGLLNAGTRETQLTWMDARVNGVAVTPRFGKAVEINALWYNALRLMTDWARERGEHQTETLFGAMANQAIAGFTASFWNVEKGCLFDVLGDAQIRPNQLFALSLPFPLVTRAKGEAILRVVESKLLTPMGLRTLAPEERGYRGRFEGGPFERDTAYHQGTVWPWLLGPYARACLKVRVGDQARLRDLLVRFCDQLDVGCLGQLAEVYDGDAPQREGGTPAQAWSVAEVLWLLSKELAF